MTTATAPTTPIVIGAVKSGGGDGGGGGSAGGASGGRGASPSQIPGAQSRQSASDHSMEKTSGQRQPGATRARAPVDG